MCGSADHEGLLTHCYGDEVCSVLFEKLDVAKAAHDIASEKVVKAFHKQLDIISHQKKRNFNKLPGYVCVNLFKDYNTYL